MKYPDNRMLFTVNEVSKACGVSRATLLRMEESGFLKPYHTDPDSGYRYYDADNITQIGQYQLLMDLGLTRKEAADLYYHWGHMDTENLLDKQRHRINRLQRLLHELEMKYEHANDFAFSYVQLLETTCFCAPISADSFTELEPLAYDLFQRVVEEGFHIQVTEPHFILMPTAPQEEPVYCIPVISSGTADARLKTFPACRAFSVIAHGDYSIIPTMMEYTQAAFSSRDLKAVGTPRLIAHVAPYVGGHIDPKDYCYEYVVPIER